MFLYEEFVNKGALTGIAGVAPTLDGASLDGPALYQGTSETLPEDDESVNDGGDFDENEIGRTFEEEFETLDSATGSGMVFNLFIEGEEPELVEFEDDALVVPTTVAPAAPTPEPATPLESPASLIAAIKTHYTETAPMVTPADWLTMNAPRPLLGTKTIDNGEFLTGRFYAAIDPYDSMAAAYIRANIKQGAEMVLLAAMPVQIEMALEGSGEYRAAYEAMPTEKRANAVKPLIRRIQGRPYAEAKAFLEAARASVGVREPVAPIQAPAAAEPVVQQAAPPAPATRPPGGRARPTPAQKTPNEIAAEAEYSAFTSSLKAKGGKFWASEDMKKKRYYFERTSEEYAAEIATLREAAGGSLAAWPGEKLGYVDVNTREFVSTRAGVSNADFKASLGFSPTPPTEPPQMTADKALFQSVIDGTAPDLIAPELADKMEAAHNRHIGNADIVAMFVKAVDAYGVASLAAAAHL